MKGVSYSLMHRARSSNPQGNVVAVAIFDSELHNDRGSEGKA